MKFMSRRFMILMSLFASLFLAVGLAPAASAAITGFTYTFVAKPTESGVNTLANTKRTWAPSGGAIKDQTECYKTVTRENAKVAFLETMVYGTYTSSTQAGYFNAEDNEFLGLAFYLYDRLNGRTVSKNVAWEGALYCLIGGSSTGASITVQPPFSGPLPLKSNKSRTERVYNPDNGSSVLYTECRQVATGDDAVAAMFEVIKDGNYSSDFAGYLGSYDSDLVVMGQALHSLFAGTSINRGDYMFSGKPTCF